MPCYSPLTGYRALKPNPDTGKYSIAFNIREGFKDLPITIPCGQCIGCRLEHSRRNAVRVALEAKMYTRNSFITLSYADEHLPKHSFLDKTAPVKFMKRLRKQFGSNIRSYGCAEYGEKFGRPHYHICLLNHDFDDKIHFFTTPRGDKIYTSPTLEKLWPFGHCSIGELTFESAAYTARYVTKKVTGALQELHYTYMDEHGELLTRPMEGPVCVSRRPGIGKPWLDKYTSDVYPYDLVVLRGKKMQPPKYFDKRYEIEYPSDFKNVKLARQAKANLARGSAYKYSLFVAPNNTPERMLIREEVQKLKFEKLERKYEK